MREERCIYRARNRIIEANDFLAVASHHIIHGDQKKADLMKGCAINSMRCAALAMGFDLVKSEPVETFPHQEAAQ